MPHKFKFNIEVTVDRDMVPGWGNKSRDWFDKMFGALMQNSHYNPEVIVNSVALLDYDNAEIYKSELSERVSNTIEDMDEILTGANKIKANRENLT